ncbi:hypothetical protein [Aliarcobacter skirrowii]|uniref:hypothetical protein n=1 Tax=Aliarcobacter skirrowii TaxID=28200 RepID=UPI0029B57DFC|nr:hypothetical protein [Aliarcobacter skirrowii]MDX4036246.1 hypothetical protein [Aliarcobacter skirrowii]
MQVSIDDIWLNKSVQIYKKIDSIPKSLIENLFVDLGRKRIGNYVKNEIRKEHSSNVYYSVLSFKFEEEPSFLAETNEKEIKYSYLFILETNEYFFVNKKHISSIEKYFSDYIESFDYEEFSHFKADKKPKYEKVSIGNMSISDAVIRSRSYEASNLEGTLPLSSASRSVARSLRLNESGKMFSITPNTSRISQRDIKINVNDYVLWCLQMANEITSNTHKSDFINCFAKPITLEDILLSSKPIGVLFHFEVLEELIELDELKLYIDNGTKSRVLLNSNELKMLFMILRKTFNIREKVSTTNEYEVYNKRIIVAEFRANKRSISFKESMLDNIFLDNTSDDSLKDFISSNKFYSIVFDNPKYSFIGKYAFFDNNLLTETNINKILSICITNHKMLDIGVINSEKEKPSNKASVAKRSHFNSLSRFPKESLFYRVEEYFNTGILICDDMNDEWADHINIADDSISLIHSKFTTKDSYGASKMHDVVSQALKNIARVHATVDEYRNKYNNKWKDNYESTQIRRLRKDGDDINVSFQDIEEALTKIHSKPNARKKIYLATPFFSKDELEIELKEFILNTQRNVHYFQLIWLLSTFISSCQDYGVNPYILCKD